jgi:hypothetical protein
LWESGGGYTNTGEAQIIAGPHGEKLKPVYVRTKGHRANGQHALFVVQPKYHVIQVGYWNKQDPPYDIRVYQITKIVEFQPNPDFSDKQLLAVAVKSTEESKLKEAIDAAIAKTRCYHCRTPHWAGDQQ